MGTVQRDFASLLDELLVVTEAPEDSGRQPTIPFDYLAVADELLSGRIKMSSDAVAAEYRESSSFEAELAALLAEASLSRPEPVPEAPLPSTEPEDIAVELGLASAGADDLGRLRRTFAFRNHPDRVAPHMRQLALRRMQVANQLIDEAKRRAVAKTAR